MTAFSVRNYAMGDNALVLDLSGELDISTVQDLEAAFNANGGGKYPVLVLDLRHLSFIDSTGLRSIVQVESKMRSVGKRVVLVPGPESVERVFRLTGLAGRLEFVSEPSDVTGEHPGD